MKHLPFVLFFLVIGTVASSCTTARWTVKDRHALDPSEYEIVSEEYLLKAEEKVTPENPVFTLNLHSKRTYRYNQRVQVQRNIQDYRPQAGFSVLGLTGAALAMYVAHAPGLSANISTPQYYTLTAAGSLMALTGLLNMKPSGEPRPTGEERLLRTSGDSTRVDTVRVRQSVQQTAALQVSYNDSLIFREESRNISAGQLVLPLPDKVEDLQPAGLDPGSIAVSVEFEDSTYSYHFPINTILEPYIRVTSSLTALRNSPAESADNIVADLMNGSLIKVLDYNDKGWYRVQYGISENYVRKDDAELIWRASGFARDSDILSVPRIPFGNVDVESNIPMLSRTDSNAVALVISNENYPGEQSRSYAHRDGELISAYLKNALGFLEENIISLQDIETEEQLWEGLDRITGLAKDSTNLFVYINGNGAIQQDSSGYGLSLLTVNEDTSLADSVNLAPLFRQLAELPYEKSFFLNDIDFSLSGNSGLSDYELQDVIDEVAKAFIERERSALLLGMQLNQPSGLYISSRGEDKKHHIFPYYFTKALQQRRTRLSAIYQYLQRNIPYTSRKLHDIPQDPILLGDTTLDLVSE